MRPAQTDSFWEQNRLVWNSSPNKETTLNVKENVGAMLEQVQSYLADVERKLKKAEENLAQRAMRRTPDRALYVNRDGSMKVEEAMIEHSNLTQEAHKTVIMPDSWLSSGVCWKCGPATVRPIWHKRRYRLMFSQGTLHVYQEMEIN